MIQLSINYTYHSKALRDVGRFRLIQGYLPLPHPRWPDQRHKPSEKLKQNSQDAPPDNTTGLLLFSQFSSTQSIKEEREKKKVPEIEDAKKAEICKLYSWP